jgi:hypothetical protein
MSYGKCYKKGQLNEVFNPRPSMTGEPEQTARIITMRRRKYCNGTVDGCVVLDRAQCLAYAIENQINYGVWGGKTVRERRRARS